MKKAEICTNYDSYDISKARSDARFVIRNMNLSFSAHCDVKNEDRYAACPIEASMGRSDKYEYAVKYNADGERVVELDVHGASSLFNTLRQTCAACRHNKIRECR